MSDSSSPLGREPDAFKAGDLSICCHFYLFSFVQPLDLRGLFHLDVRIVPLLTKDSPSHSGLHQPLLLPVSVFPASASASASASVSASPTTQAQHPVLEGHPPQSLPAPRFLNGCRLKHTQAKTTVGSRAICQQEASKW